MISNHKIPFFVSALLLITLIGFLLVAGCTLPTSGPVKATPAQTPVSTVPPAPAAPAISLATTEPVVPAAEPITVATPVPTTASSVKHYSNSLYGFSIDYPSNWEVNELDQVETDISLTRFHVVDFYSPSFVRCNTDKSECVNVRAEVKIEAETNPPAELEDFYVKDVARITSGSGLQITKRDAMYKLDGTKSYRLDYLVQNSKEHYNALSAYVLRGGTGYILTYHGHAPEREETTNQFEEYYNDVMAMFSSFTASSSNLKTI